MFKPKVLMVGPCQSYKTTIANFLSDATEASNDDYHPTKGCRILEFQVSNIPTRTGKNVNADVELWDCSGDNKYESCWPAMAKDSVGIVFVFNKDNPEHDSQLETWHTYFVKEHGLKESQCIIFANTTNTSRSLNDDDDEISLPSQMRQIQYVNTNIMEDADSIHHEFKHFISSIMSTMSERREKEELSIMNQR